MPKQQTVAKTVVDQLAEWGIDAVFGVVRDAAQDRVPLLVIAGRVESWYVGTNHKQYFDHLSLYRPFATYTAMLANPQSTVEVLAGKDPAANAIARADLCQVAGATWWPGDYAPRSLPVSNRLRTSLHRGPDTGALRDCWRCWPDSAPPYGPASGQPPS